MVTPRYKPFASDLTLDQLLGLCRRSLQVLKQL